MPSDLPNPYESPRTVSKPDEESVNKQADSSKAPDRIDENDVVNVAAFQYVQEAELARMMLEEQGIQAELADDGVVGGFSLWSNAVGGVKVIVRRKDADRAARFLEEHRESLVAKRNGEPIEFECEECGAPLRFPGNRRGRVETCPKCRDFIDVPE